MQQGFPFSRHDAVILIAWPCLNIVMAYSLILCLALRSPDIETNLLMHNILHFFITKSVVFWELTKLFHSKVLKVHAHKMANYLVVNLVLGLVAILVTLIFTGPLPTEYSELRTEVLIYFNTLLQVAIYAIVNYHWQFKKHSIELEILLKRSELNLLRMQTNPHFLFNTLNLISREVPERPDLAQELIYDLSDLLRGTIQVSNQKRIRVREEMDLVTHYISIQQARFGERLVTEFELDSPAQDIDIPPMIILPLVENVIKHALSKTHQTVRLNIKTMLLKDRLIVQVSNSWPEKEDPTFIPGSGLKNIIDTLNLEYVDACLEMSYQSKESVATITIRENEIGNTLCIG